MSPSRGRDPAAATADAEAAGADPARLRRAFPLLEAAGARLHYLDNAATAQILGEAQAATMTHDSQARANVLRGTYALAEAASGAFEAARAEAARFLNAGAPDEIVFTAGTTAAINLFAATLPAGWKTGDEIVVSALEHHSNFVPWQQACQRHGLRLRIVPVTAQGRLDLAALAGCLGARSRLVALTHASNVTGAVTDVAEVVAAARRVGAAVLLDGAQAVQHGPVDVQALGVDFYAFSGHKCFGPTGIGVAWGRRERLAALPPYMTGGGMVGEVGDDASSFAPPPRRFEAGTPAIAQAVGLAAALAWLRRLPWQAIRQREAALCARLIAGLQAFPEARLLGPADQAQRLPIVSFTLDGIHPHDLCQVLDARGLCLRGGHHCAQPLLRALGVEACARASIALYNDAADIEALLAGIDEALRLLR